MRKSALLVVVAGLGPQLLCPSGVSANEIFDARGFNPYRPSATPLPFEHVDTLNGNLLLVFTDLALPGNAGFELRIQRSYNSKIFRDEGFGALDWDSWGGIGWSLHLGRVRTTFQDVPLAVEMPDGSSHKLFSPFAGGTGAVTDVTRDYWLYHRDPTAPTLKLTNGVVYTFGKVVTFGSGSSYRYATRIQDAFGNRIDIEYDTIPTAPDAIKKITQFLGPPANPLFQRREITFTTETVGARSRLRTMAFLGRTWTYSYVASADANKSLLTQVQPPLGRPWTLAYATSGAIRHELVQLTTPQGGTVTWTYGTQGGGSGALASPFYLGSTVPVRARVVTSRTSSGRDVPVGTRTYAYAQGAARNQTIITEPLSCSGAAAGSTTVYTFRGVGDGYAPSNPRGVWEIGLLDRREVKQGGTVLETEQLVWRGRASNGDDDVSSAIEQIGPTVDHGIYAPVVSSRTLTRGGQAYVTTNTYHSQSYSPNGPNFNDYGRPYRIVETGDAGTRATERTFPYGFTPYIKDRVGTEAVTVGAESFRRSVVYNLANGFATDEYGWGQTPTSGIHTSFVPDATGNVASVTDANGHTTSYTYDWGVRDDVRTPAYPGADTLRRVINADGTVQSETRRLNENNGSGYTTSYTYDALSRVKTVTPPLGLALSHDYDDANSQSLRVTRGSHFSRTDLDGFGRPSATSNSVGVQTDLSYDACDRKSYESLPFDSQHPKDTSGLRYEYDGLGRVTRRTNPGAPASAVSNRYSGSGLSGIDVETVDEEGRRITQEWTAFGDPQEARLASVTLDSGGSHQQVTGYDYNALGSLTEVSGQGSLSRSFVYTPRNELLSETHPESGRVAYTYDAAGNLATRTDARGTQANHSYDANDRLVCVDQPPHAGTSCASLSDDDVAIGYDRADNRISLANPSVTSTFSYDAANRLASRTDRISGPNGLRQFTTGYAYDGRDNLEVLTHPTQSALAVRYTYDAGNRITDVRRNGAASSWASAFAYHPSGAPESFTAGNGLKSTTSYTARQWTDLSRVGSGADPRKVLSLDYGYDRVGNVTSIADDTTGRIGMSQTLGYDALDRLEAASGPWGSTRLVVNSTGDRTSKTDGGGTTSYSYDGATGRLRALSGAQNDSFSYDENGNQLSGGGVTSGYTLRNLVQTATAGGVTTTYRYDGDDQRKLKVQEGKLTYYVHDPQGRLLAELEETCAGTVVPVRDYVYAGSRLVAAIKPDSVASVSFQAGASTVSEGAGSHSITVVLATASPSLCPIQVEYVMYAGTAQAGKDFVLANGTVTFPPNSPSGATQTIPVTILNDALDEDDETFTVQLTGTGAVRLHQVTILDNDLPPDLSIGPATTTVTEGDSGLVPVTLTVSLSAVSGRVVRVDYATAPGTATAGDYQNASGTLVFPAEGGTSQAVTVKVVGDLVRDLDEEYFTVGLMNPVNAGVSGGPARVVIRDDDMPVVRVLRPNGGESWPARSIQTLSWTSSKLGASATIRLSYTDGTSTYPIVNGLGRTAVSYNWTVPDTEASSWRLTVCSDVAGTCEAQDSSDGLLSITAPVVSSPRLDWNGDGKNDLLLRYPPTGELVAWYLDGVTKTGGAALSAKPGSLDWVPVGVADFNSDGKPDVLFRYQPGGDLVVWYMNGVTKTGGAGLVPAKPGSLDWVPVGVDDFNSDGKPDILFRSQSGGDLVVWYMNGVTKTGGAALSAKPGSLDWAPVGVADFSGDGKPDIVFRHRTTGQHVVWTMDGVTKTGGAELQPPSPADTRWQAVALGDYSRDGEADIVWQLGATGDVSVWFLEGVTKVGGSATSPAVVTPPWAVVAPR